mgnify:CR=1 FL=1
MLTAENTGAAFTLSSACIFYRLTLFAIVVAVVLYVGFMIMPLAVLFRVI